MILVSLCLMMINHFLGKHCVHVQCTLRTVHRHRGIAWGICEYRMEPYLAAVDAAYSVFVYLYYITINMLRKGGTKLFSH